jgi:hypothetical protein
LEFLSHSQKGEISETIEQTLTFPGMPGHVEEITETLSLNLPEITSITISEDDPQNIIRLSPELVTAVALDYAVKLVERKARAQKPQDDRVVGQVDMIKAALSVPLFNELVPAVKVRVTPPAKKNEILFKNDFCGSYEIRGSVFFLVVICTWT